MRGRARPRVSRGLSHVGERLEVEVGPVAHGGHCVARAEGLPVLFTRHALPGERVVVEVTEGCEGDRFWRADAVEVLDASPDRVPAPCPVAGADGCGGCDLQHVALPAQRRLKADVVREQLVRLGGLAGDDPLLGGLAVEAVPGDEEGLRWRTRQRYATMPDGRRAMRKHRSHELVPVDDCLIDARAPASHRVRGREFEVAHDGFWQVHPGAPEVLVDTVLAVLAPRTGESVLDLYAGVGVFTAFLADAVGPSSRVVAVEGDRAAAERARANLGDRVQVVAGPVQRVLDRGLDQPFDLVVLDPPRQGAKRAVVEQVVDRAPRAVGYVACDPAALGRDVATFAEHGYRLTSLCAFDLFPMTSHVEVVALLSKDS